MATNGPLSCFKLIFFVVFFFFLETWINLKLVNARQISLDQNNCNYSVWEKMLQHSRFRPQEWNIYKFYSRFKLMQNNTRQMGPNWIGLRCNNRSVSFAYSAHKLASLFLFVAKNCYTMQIEYNFRVKRKTLLFWEKKTRHIAHLDIKQS